MFQSVTWVKSRSEIDGSKTFASFSYSLVVICTLNTLFEYTERFGGSLLLIFQHSSAVEEQIRAGGCNFVFRRLRDEMVVAPEPILSFAYKSSVVSVFHVSGVVNDSVEAVDSEIAAGDKVLRVEARIQMRIVGCMIVHMIMGVRVGVRCVGARIRPSSSRTCFVLFLVWSRALYSLIGGLCGCVRRHIQVEGE